MAVCIGLPRVIEKLPFSSLLNRMGIRSRRVVLDLIPTGPIRDLFAEVAAKESAPFTPDALTLNTYWQIYRQSVEAQFLDVGLGGSILYDALVKVHQRFCCELERPYYEHPFLLVISDGNLDDAQDEDLYRVVKEIELLGVRIVSCYVSRQNVTISRKLYDSPDANWPKTALRLFRCASRISRDSEIENTILEIAREKGWHVSEQARWFIQVNQSQMLEELIEVVLSPLKERALERG